MNDLEQYNNIVELLKQALNFYADESNYVDKMHDCSQNVLSDGGSQARFALKRTEELKAQYDKMVDDFEEELKNISSEENINPEEITKIINDLKKI